MTRKVFAGVDVGGTKIAAALVDDKGDVLAREKTATPRKAGPKRIIKTVEGLVKGLAAQKGLRLRQLGGVGVGAPGIVAPGGRVLAAPNIDLTGCALGAKLSKRLGVRVAVGNDANLGVLGEQWLGAAKGAQDVVGLFVGTGVGGGVIVNGRLLDGAHGAAGELGHLIMDPAGAMCGCGNRGCLEAFASRTAVEREIRRAVVSGERSLITELAGGKLDVIKSKALFKALKKKDPVVTRVMRGAAYLLGSACATLRHVFDPELFIFGGGVIEACGGFILPIVQHGIDQDPFFRGVARCRAVPATLGDDAVILGAVALARASR